MAVLPDQQQTTQLANLIEENQDLVQKLRQIRSEQKQLEEKVIRLEAAVELEKVRSQELEKRAEDAEKRLATIQAHLQRVLHDVQAETESAPDAPAFTENAEPTQESAVESDFVLEPEASEPEEPVKPVDANPIPEPDFVSDPFTDAIAPEATAVPIPGRDLSPEEVQSARMWIRALESTDEDERALAHEGLLRLGHRVSGMLLEALDQANGNTRRTLVRLLAHSSVPSAPVAARLRECLFEDDAHIREDAVRGLSWDPASSLAPLLLATRDEHWHVRKLAKEAIEKVPGDLAKQLADQLTNDNPKQRVLVLKALATLGNRSVPTFEQVRRCLDSDRPEIIEAAAFALAAMGKSAAPAAEQLCKHFVHAKPSVRSAIVQALTAMGDDALPQVQATLEHEEMDSLRRGELLKILATRGLADSKASAILAHLFESSNVEERIAAIRAVGTAGPSASTEMIDRLIQALHDSAPSVREEAALALGEVGPAARDAVPHLERIVSEWDTGTTGFISRLLRRMDPDALVPKMIGRISGQQDRNARARPAASDALVRILEEDDEQAED